MNEQIKQLAVKAGLYVDLDGTPWPRAMSAEECEAAYKKFAELIVRECALVVHKKTGPKSALNVLEHFGVAE
jgi:hypothetical protein